MGTVGGLQTFGLMGIFIGPVIVALGKAILDEWLATQGRSRPTREVTITEAGKSFRMLGKRCAGFAGNDLTDGPLLMNPEGLAQSPLENLPRAALGQLAC